MRPPWLSTTQGPRLFRQPRIALVSYPCRFDAARLSPSHLPRSRQGAEGLVAPIFSGVALPTSPRKFARTCECQLGSLHVQLGELSRSPQVPGPFFAFQCSVLSSHLDEVADQDPALSRS